MVVLMALHGCFFVSPYMVVPIPDHTGPSMKPAYLYIWEVKAWLVLHVPYALYNRPYALRFICSWWISQLLSKNWLVQNIWLRCFWSSWWRHMGTFSMQDFFMVNKKCLQKIWLKRFWSSWWRHMGADVHSTQCAKPNPKHVDRHCPFDREYCCTVGKTKLLDQVLNWNRSLNSLAQLWELSDEFWWRRG